MRFKKFNRRNEPEPSDPVIIESSGWRLMTRTRYGDRPRRFKKVGDLL